jgi:2-phospho-L-lactate transferase/gluconeogenesis factor (CofD/UPF0052 family)
MKFQIDKKQYDEIFVFGGGQVLTTVRMLNVLNPKIREKINIVVTMSDDGGRTGKLMNIYPGLLPPGDLRRAYQALCNRLCFLLIDNFNEFDTTDYSLMNLLTKQYENDIEKLKEIREIAAFKKINFSFDKLHDKLTEHSVGNIVIAAAMMSTECLSDAVETLAQIFNISGAIYPIIDRVSHIEATYENGKTLKSETEIGDLDEDWGRIVDFKLISESGSAPEPYKPLIKKLESNTKKLGFIGNGSVFTSIIASIYPIQDYLKNLDFVLLVNKINNSEVMNFNVSDYVNLFEEYGIDKVVRIVCNKLNKGYRTKEYFNSIKDLNEAVFTPVKCDLDREYIYEVDMVRDNNIFKTDIKKLGARLHDVGLKVI